METPVTQAMKTLPEARAKRNFLEVLEETFRCPNVAACGSWGAGVEGVTGPTQARSLNCSYVPIREHKSRLLYACAVQRRATVRDHYMTGRVIT